MYNKNIKKKSIALATVALVAANSCLLYTSPSPRDTR